jgi:hypothetical protein
MEVMKMTRLTIVCISFIVVSLMFVSVSDAKIDPNKAAGIWLFDERSGDTAKDSSKNVNDGTFVGNVERVEGKFGTALEFDGASSYVDCGNVDNLSITGDLTFSMWVKISEYPTGWRNMLSKLESDTRNEFNFRYKTSTAAQFYFGTGAAAIVLNWNPSEDLPLDTWTHIAGVRKSKTYLKLYFDGVEKRSLNITADAISTNAHVTIGRQSDNKFYFEGIIDEVGIFNVVLPVAEIQTIMNKGFQAFMAAVSPSGKLASTWADIKQ